MVTPASAGPSGLRSAIQWTATADSSTVPPEVISGRNELAEREEQLRKAREELDQEQAHVNNKRMSLQLLHMLERPSKPDAPTSAKGIGFYTHVAGTPKIPRFPHEKYVQAEPEFLPLGGPRRITRKGDRLSELDGKIEKRWRDVQTLVQKEEDFSKKTAMTLPDLAKRYVPSERPMLAARLHGESPSRQVQLQRRDVQVQNGISSTGRRHSAGTTSTSPLARRPSGGVEFLQSFRGGITAPNRSTYEPSRDPRLQRR